MAFIKNSKTGFTIVELLIVIVVIAILASISIVAYNGIQTRAQNTKNTQAVAAWAKALIFYKADTGSYPVTNSCLGARTGNVTTYGDTGDANKNNGRCWGTNTNSTWFVNTTFLSDMADYISNPAEPSDVNVRSGTDQRRGAIYYRVAAGDERIYVATIGITAQADCPPIGPLGASYGGTTFDGGRECYYRLPQ